MSWLRWWTGTVNDPKWRIVASRAKCRAGDCVAVWAYLLEIAKDGEGDISSADAEECAVVLGYEVEVVEAIIAAMRDKSLLDGDRVASWGKRQPKREDDSRARVAAYRARQAETKIVTEQSVELRNDTVTHGNAPESESDTEKNISSLRSDIERAQSAAPARQKKPKPEKQVELADPEILAKLSPWLSAETAAALIASRRGLGCKHTEFSVALLSRELAKCRDPTAQAERAILNNWKSVYPEKDHAADHGSGQSRATSFGSQSSGNGRGSGGVVAAAQRVIGRIEREEHLSRQRHSDHGEATILRPGDGF